MYHHIGAFTFNQNILCRAQYPIKENVIVIHERESFSEAILDFHQVVTQIALDAPCDHVISVQSDSR